MYKRKGWPLCPPPRPRLGQLSAIRRCPPIPSPFAPERQSAIWRCYLPSPSASVGNLAVLPPLARQSAIRRRYLPPIRQQSAIWRGRLLAPPHDGRRSGGAASSHPRKTALVPAIPPPFCPSASRKVPEKVMVGLPGPGTSPVSRYPCLTPLLRRTTEYSPERARLAVPCGRHGLPMNPLRPVPALLSPQPPCLWQPPLFLMSLPMPSAPSPLLIAPQSSPPGTTSAAPVLPRICCLRATSHAPQSTVGRAVHGPHHRRPCLGLPRAYVGGSQ